MSCEAYPYCDRKDAAIERLRQENAELRERLEALEKSIVSDTDWIDLDGLSPYERLLLILLMRRPHATHQQIYDFLYGLRPSEKDLPSPEMSKVWACKLRKWLRARGLDLENKWGVGYSLRPEVKAALRRERA